MQQQFDTKNLQRPLEFKNCHAGKEDKVKRFCDLLLNDIISIDKEGSFEAVETSAKMISRKFTGSLRGKICLIWG